MGTCCYKRDSNDRSSNLEKLEELEKLERQLKSNENFYSMNTTSVDVAPLKEMMQIDPQELKQSLESFQKENEWDQMINLISDSRPIKESSLKLSWTKPPTTVGSFVIVHLCKLLQEDSEEIGPYLEKKIPVLVDLIRSNIEDIRDNSLLLLYYYLDEPTEECIAELLKLNIFTILIRNFRCNNEPLRHLTAGVCYKIYKNRNKVIRIFIELNGADMLLQQISWSSENQEALSILMEYFLGLLKNDEGTIFWEIHHRLKEDLSLEIFQKISQNSEGDQKFVKEILQILEHDVESEELFM